MRGLVTDSVKQCLRYCFGLASEYVSERLEVQVVQYDGPPAVILHLHLSGRSECQPFRSTSLEAVFVSRLCQGAVIPIGMIPCTG